MAWIRFLPSAAGKTRHGGKIDWIAKAKNIRPGAPSLRFDAIPFLKTPTWYNGMYPSCASLLYKTLSHEVPNL